MKPSFPLSRIVGPLLALALASLATADAGAAGRIRIIASINDLGTIASAVGGDQVDVAAGTAVAGFGDRVAEERHLVAVLERDLGAQ